MLLLFFFNFMLHATSSNTPPFSCEQGKSYEFNAGDAKLKNMLDEQIKDRAIRLKLESIFDIAIGASQNWSDLSGAEFHNASQCDNKVFDYYRASREAAEYLLKNTSSNALRKQKEDLIYSRIKAYLELHEDISKLAEIRGELSRMLTPLNPNEGVSRPENEERKKGREKIYQKKSEQIQNIKKPLEEIEKKLSDKNIIFEYPDLFEPKSPYAFDLDILGLNKSVGAFIPNDLYENIQNWIYSRYFVEEKQEEAFAEYAVTLPRGVLDISSLRDEKNLRRLVHENFNELNKIFNKKYANMFYRAHDEMYRMCSDKPQEFYFNDTLITLSAEDLVSSGKIDSEDLSRAYTSICSLRSKMTSDAALLEKRMHYLTVANTWLGYVGLVFVGGSAVSWGVRKVVNRWATSWSTKIASLSSRLNIYTKPLLESYGVIYASTLLAEGQLGISLNTYDLEIKNLFLLRILAKKSTASEADKLKGEVASLVLKAGESQRSQSESFLGSVSGASFLGLSLLTIPITLRELNEIDKLLKVRSIFQEFSRGELTQSRFLEELYTVKTGSLKEYEAWLKNMNLKSPPRSDSVAQLLQSSVIPENLKKSAGEVMTLIAKYKSTESLKALEDLIYMSRYNSKQLENVLQIIKAASESEAKQRYLVIVAASKKMNNADRAILQGWTDSTAIDLLTGVKLRAMKYAMEDKVVYGQEQRAWEKALKEELGFKGYSKLCVEGECAACFVK